MKISENWLREWVDPQLTTDELVEQLTIAGLEVDGVEPVAGEFTQVVVAEVVEVEPHPDADKLKVCKVDTGEGQTTQVVCGAANVSKGMKAPFAKVGANLPGGFKIKKAKLRGVESFGMLCSEQELGMAASADGLLALPGGSNAGLDIRDYLGLDDTIIEVDLTPNRGDCLGVLGIAREVAALNNLPFNILNIEKVAVSIEDTTTVKLDAPEACPAYTGRVVKGVNAKAETPLWMIEKLRRSGIRSVSAIVDVTNYILLEMGQPMHAFDRATLHGDIHARYAKAKEKLVLLDGKEVELDEDILVIADDQQSLAMAGIMGGESSSVTDDTIDLFLEVAYFNPLAIAGRARRYGLHTDSSHRFERGVDPELQQQAMERATALILEICGGEAGPVLQAKDETAYPQSAEVTLRSERVASMLGIGIPDEQIAGYLKRLGMQVSGSDGNWTVTPPSHRFDISIEADLIEEVARLYGYNNIPQTLPSVPQFMVADQENNPGMDVFKDVLAQRGWQEAITYSFIDPGLQQAVGFDRPAVPLSNPISSEMSVMRTSHWPGLIQALQHNQNRQQKRVRLFESGLIFTGMEAGEQDNYLSGIACGEVVEEQWGQEKRKLDFFDVKGDIESLFSQLRSRDELGFEPATHPALHPGQTARILRNGNPVGWIGVMHPEQEKKHSIDGPVVLFEIEAAALHTARPRQFEAISKFPNIRRDLSLIVDSGVTAQSILDEIDTLGLKTISKKWVFDVYQGKGVEIGRKSMSLGLILLDSSRTLTDEDVEETVGLVIDKLGEKLNASLRD